MKIAPTLARLMGPGVLMSEWTPERKVAVRELRALLAVAREAKRFHRYVNGYSDPIDDYDLPMRRALDRLDAVSKGKQ